MAETFEERIDFLVGEGSAGDLGLTTAKKQSAFDEGLRAVVRGLPNNALDFAAKKTTFAPTSGTQVRNPKVLRVLRNDGTVNRVCNEIDLANVGSAVEKGSFYEVSPFTPAYYREPQASGFVLIKILPTSATATHGILYHVVIPPISISNTGMVAGFPEELEGLPVIYAAGSILLRESGVTRRVSQDQVEAAVTAMANYASALPALVPPSTTEIDDALLKAQTLMDAGASTGGDSAAAAISFQTNIASDRHDKAQTALAGAAQETRRASTRVQAEQMKIQEFRGKVEKAASYLTEAQARLAAAVSYDGKATLAWKAGKELIEQFRDEMQLYKGEKLGGR